MQHIVHTKLYIYDLITITSAGGLLVPEGIIHPPLLVDY